MRLSLKPSNLTWKELARRVWDAAREDDIFGRSAQLAYYFFLALFPLLICVAAILGFFPSAAEHGRVVLFRLLGEAVPFQARRLIETTYLEIVQSRGGGKISFGILATLWAASAGMASIMDTLNSAYDVRESRSLLKRYFTAVILAVIDMFLLAAAIGIVLFGDKLAESILLFGVVQVVWKIVQWPIAIAFVLLAFALLHYFAPDLKARQWESITPGTAASLLLWLAVSLALRLYFYFFNTYTATYGSLGSVMVLLLWFYVTGGAILIGAELNAVIRKTAAKDENRFAESKNEVAPPPGDANRRIA